MSPTDNAPAASIDERSYHIQMERFTAMISKLSKLETEGDMSGQRD
jgi:hypothetical protein